MSAAGVFRNAARNSSTTSEAPAMPPIRAAVGGAIETSARGAQGQEPFAEIAVCRVAVACESSRQWCTPLRRQQAGSEDSSPFARHTVLSALTGTTASAGPNPRPIASKMERIRRIRSYATTGDKLRNVDMSDDLAKVLSKNAEYAVTLSGMVCASSSGISSYKGS